ncbi:hypothetical protein ACHWQZ_G010627 [Mnemiopsis leidyi]
MLSALLLASLPAFLLAHIHEYDKHLLNTVYKPTFHEGYCHDTPTVFSYHIHLLFWGNNKDRVNSALELRDQFIEKFNLQDKKCDISPVDPAPGHGMCSFEVDLVPAGPFNTAQYAFFIPLDRLQETSMWMLQHRGVHDVFIHPNSGCPVNDHTKWNTVAGDKWPVDVSVFPPF